MIVVKTAMWYDLFVFTLLDDVICTSSRTSTCQVSLENYAFKCNLLPSYTLSATSRGQMSTAYLCTPTPSLSCF